MKNDYFKITLSEVIIGEVMKLPWKDTMNLNEALHAPVRIAIMLFLLSNIRAKFSVVQKALDITSGNLSSHLKKLEEEEFVFIEKAFVEKKPTTIISITQLGISAIFQYVEILNSAIEKAE